MVFGHVYYNVVVRHFIHYPMKTPLDFLLCSVFFFNKKNININFFSIMFWLLYVLHNNNTLVKWLECSPMARETWVQSQVESYQRLKKWYLMPPCLTLSVIRYGSRVKWSNPGKEVAPSYRKGSLWVTLDYGHQLLQ